MEVKWNMNLYGTRNEWNNALLFGNYLLFARFADIILSMLISGRWGSFFTDYCMIISILYYYSTKMESPNENTSNY